MKLTKFAIIVSPKFHASQRLSVCRLGVSLVFDFFEQATKLVTKVSKLLSRRAGFSTKSNMFLHIGFVTADN